jgi:hypothetical protein
VVLHNHFYLSTSIQRSKGDGNKIYLRESIEKIISKFCVDKFGFISWSLFFFGTTIPK